MKRCSRCRKQLPLARFHVDRSRGDGHAYVCISCRLTPRSDPSRRQRILMRAVGLTWCSGCRAWCAAEAVRQGKCRKHLNERDRARYRRDATYRTERREHAHSRKRGIDPIPAEAQADILELFAGRCAYCPAPAATWDHIVPISKGGRTTPGNVVPCCRRCNSRKRNRDPEEWLDAPERDLHPALVDRLALADAGLYG